MRAYGRETQTRNESEISCEGRRNLFRNTSLFLAGEAGESIYDGTRKKVNLA